jgi:hypothetical protein
MEPFPQYGGAQVPVSGKLCTIAYRGSMVRLTSIDAAAEMFRTPASTRTHGSPPATALVVTPKRRMSIVKRIVRATGAAFPARPPWMHQAPVNA